jgi:gliding motility-associated-like protein
MRSGAQHTTGPLGWTKRLLFFCTFLVLQLFPQVAKSQTTQGTDFWLTPMINYVNTDSFFVILSAEKATNAKVEIPLLGFSQTISLGYNDLIRVYIPNSYKPSSLDTTCDCGIHVTSFLPISVYTLSAQSATTDASCIFPTAVQPAGGEYFTLNPINYSSGYNIGNEVGVVCIDDSVTVQITPATTTSNGYPGGVPYSKKLYRGQVYLFSSASKVGLEGSIIKASAGKRIAVFSGDKCIAIRCAACDHVYEEIPPTPTWGKNFVLTPFSQQDKGYDYQIITASNGTEIRENGVRIATLNRGNVFYRKVNGDSSFCLTSTEPILLVQYMTGKNCQTVGGDPAMLVINPLEQTIKYATVSTANTTLVKDHYITIAIPKSGIDSVYLDGALLAKNSFDTVPCGSYYFYRGKVNPGNHTIECRYGFICYLYGIGGFESYAYSAGSGLRNLKRYIVPESYPSCDSGFIVKLTSYGDTSNAFRWTFNSTQKDTVKSPFFYVKKPGIYPVKLLYKLVGKKTWDSSMIDVLVEKPKYSDFILFDKKVVCDTQLTITLPKAPFLKYKWNTGDTTAILKIRKSGKYSVDIKNTITGCKTKDSCDLKFFNPVRVGLKYKMTLYCPGIPLYLYDSSTVVKDSITSYSWYADQYLISKSKADTIKSPRANKYDIKLIIETKNGCKDSASAGIFISDFPVARLGIKKLDSCYKTNLFRFNSGSTSTLGKINKLKWLFSNGDTVFGMQPQLNFKDSGLIKVRMIAYTETGCFDTTDAMSFRVYPAPKSAVLVQDSSICLNGNYFDFRDGTVTDGKSKKYLWDMGDGSGNTFQNAGKIAYADTGVYQVKFIASFTTTGCGDTAYRKVKVIQNPKAIITLDSSNFCLNRNYYAFRSSSQRNGGLTESIVWKWGDGSETLNIFSPKKTYGSVGTFKVKMYYNTGKGCLDSASKNVIIYSSPTAVIGITDSFYCGDENYFIIANNSAAPTNARWNWNFGDGNTSTVKTPGKIQYAKPGTYTIQLAVRDPLTTCTDTAKRKVKVLQFPELKIIQRDTAVCFAGDTLFFEDSTYYGNLIPRRRWIFDNNIDTNIRVNLTYKTAGIKNIRFIGGEPNVCADTVETTVHVRYDANPLRIALNVADACAPARANFQCTGSKSNWTHEWSDLSNGRNWSVIAPANIAFTTSGIYPIRLRTWDDLNCPFEKTDTLEIFAKPTADIQVISSDSQCLRGNNFNFAATTANAAWPVVFNWQLDELKAANDSLPSAKYASDGLKNIQLIIRDRNSCFDTASRQIMVFEMPKSAVIGDSSCPGSLMKLTASNSLADSKIKSSTWYINNTASGKGKIYDYASNTIGAATAYVISETIHGCKDTSNTVQLLTYPNPSAKFGVSIGTATGLGIPVLFFDSSTGATQWKWDIEPNVSFSSPSFTYIYKRTGDTKPRLIVQNAQGCADTAFLEFTLFSGTDGWVPSSFTPNGDNRNDQFIIGGLSAASTFTMSIFNRWGEKVFETSDPSMGWDGTYQGQAAQQGVYAYTIHVLYFNGIRRSFQGQVTLLR